MKIKRRIISVLCIFGMLFGSISSVAASEGVISGTDAREKAFNMMWRMATVAWTPSKTVYYTRQTTPVSRAVFASGTNYIGMPYTQSYGSIDRFTRSFQDIDNDGILDQFQPWVPVQYASADDDNIDTVDIVLGNDCSGAIYWALSTVADVSFSVVTDMLPVNNTGLTYLTVSGAHELSSSSSYTSSVLGKEDSDETNDVSFEDMCLYYSAMQKGDVLAGTHRAGYNDASSAYGHAMMVESVDTENKTVTVLQQGVPSSEWRKIDGHKSANSQLLESSSASEGTVLWSYGTMTFEELYDLCFIPLTLPEYSEGATEDGAVTVDNQSTGRLFLASGIVESSKYRLVSVTIDIDNEDGTDFNSVTLDTTTYRWRMYSAPTPQRIIENTMDLKAFIPYLAAMEMKEGNSYKYTLSAHLSNGEDYVLKQYMFVY